MSRRIVCSGGWGGGGVGLGERVGFGVFVDFGFAEVVGGAGPVGASAGAAGGVGELLPCDDGSDEEPGSGCVSPS